MNSDIKAGEDNTNQTGDQTANVQENQESIQDENNSVQTEEESSNESKKRKEMSGDKPEKPAPKKSKPINIEEEKKKVCQELKEQNDKLMNNKDYDSHYSRPWYLHRPSNLGNTSCIEYLHAFNLSKGFYLTPGITFITYFIVLSQLLF